MTNKVNVRNLLRRIIPWSLESNSSNPKYRANYKGVRGRIGIVGGARDYAGAPYFASISAMRLGADLSYVICSQSASQAIKAYSPDLIVVPILDCDEESEFRSEIQCLLTRLHALVIGPGLGREPLLQQRAKILIEEAKLRSLALVLDADSLVLVNEHPELIKSYPHALLTPNRVELQRMWNNLHVLRADKGQSELDLRGMSTGEIRKLVSDCANKLEVAILAKGPVDIVAPAKRAAESSQLLTDESLGSNRRCGGQGDILAGLAGVYSHWIAQAATAERHQQQQQQSNQCDTIDSSDIGPIDRMALAGYLAATTTRKCNAIAYKRLRNGMLASHMIDRIHVALDELMTDEASCDYKSDDDEDSDWHARNDRDESTELGARDESSTRGNREQVTRSRVVRNAAYVGTLSLDEINRFRRQMIMDEFGPERQSQLKSKSVLVVGAGGLGCPASVYLAAAGVGKLGLVDDDRVEASNLHRQILHNTRKLGWPKVESVKRELLAINPNVSVQTHLLRLDRFNAVALIENYDIVLDCTDNVEARYLISDACVVARKPLVSGAALKLDGQLTTYNYAPDTPCFRCLFPVAPSGAAVGSCADNGVLGPIPGVIGVQQALEAVRIAAQLEPAYAGKMLLYDGQLGRFRHITLSKRRPDCQACGPDAQLGRQLIDYASFCKSSGCQATSSQPSGSGGAQTSLLSPSERISVAEYRALLESGRPHLLLDVRPSSHSQVARFAHAIQMPLAEMMMQPQASFAKIIASQQQLEAQHPEAAAASERLVFVVCRRGIASQRGARLVQQLLAGQDASWLVRDVEGGMTSWAQQVDPTQFACL